MRRTGNACADGRAAAVRLMPALYAADAFVSACCVLPPPPDSQRGPMFAKMVLPNSEAHRRCGRVARSPDVDAGRYAYAHMVNRCWRRAAAMMNLAWSGSRQWCWTIAIERMGHSAVERARRFWCSGWSEDLDAGCILTRRRVRRCAKCLLRQPQAGKYLRDLRPRTSRLVARCLHIRRRRAVHDVKTQTAGVVRRPSRCGDVGAVARC